MKKKILIFGGTGQFGLNFINTLNKNYNLVLNYNSKKFFHPNIKYVKLNIKNFHTLYLSIKKINPDIILNACAITDLDWCEKNKNKSFQINVRFAENLAKISKKCKCFFVQISTDHLFSGIVKFKKETHLKKPINTYGKQKSFAEDRILKLRTKSLIIRTNFFGNSLNLKKNFIESSIINLKNKKYINGFVDYFFTPIYIIDLVRVIDKLIKKKITGIFNIVGNERISKYDFLIKIATIFKLDSSLIVPIKFSQSKLISKRHLELSLSNNSIKKKLKINFLSLENQIKRFYKERNKIKIFNKFFYYGKHYIDKEDIKSVVNILKGDSITQGPKILESEKAVAAYVGSKYAVAVSSCTAGLHLAAKVLGVKRDQNLLTTPISFVATSNAAFYCGSKAFFSDVESDSICLNPNNLDSSFIKKNKIKCLAPVHFGGAPAEMEKINKFAKENNLTIIEDCAHALGGTYKNGYKIGSCKYSDLSVFSFHPVKIIAGGEGGIITTNSEKYYNQLLALRSHGINQLSKFIKNKKDGMDKKEKNIWYYEMINLGYHYRQTDLHSALILSQLKKIDLFLKKRSQIASQYDNIFKNNKNIEILQKNLRSNSAKHLYVIKINFKKIKKSRNFFMRELLQHQIQTQVHYIPIPIHPYYREKGYNLNNLPNAKLYYERCLSLPIHYSLTTKQISYIGDSINSLTE